MHNRNPETLVLGVLSRSYVASLKSASRRPSCMALRECWAAESFEWGSGGHTKRQPTPSRNLFTPPIHTSPHKWQNYSCTEKCEHPETTYVLRFPPHSLARHAEQKHLNAQATSSRCLLCLYNYLGSIVAAASWGTLIASEAVALHEGPCFD